MPYVDKVKSVKKTRGFPNRGERYGAKYENGVAYLLSYTVSVEKLWTQNTRIIHDVWRLLILSNEEKTNDYENFEKRNKGNNKITELRTILQRESQNS